MLALLLHPRQLLLWIEIVVENQILFCLGAFVASRQLVQKLLVTLLEYETRSLPRSGYHDEINHRFVRLVRRRPKTAQRAEERTLAPVQQSGAARGLTSDE